MVSFARHTNTPIEQVKAMDVDEFVADARALARVIAAEAPKSKQQMRPVMGVLTSKLILSLVDRVTAPARAVAKTMDRLKLAQAANARQLDAMRGRMLDAAAMGYTLSRALSAPVKSAMAFESAMADVNKVVDFAQPDGLKQMSNDILQMSRRIPMAATGIAEIVAAAGQAGMQGGELLEFAEMAAKVGVAFDISAGQAGDSLAKIKTALGLSVAQTRALADAMNHLSNTSASAAPDLLDFMSRVGSIGKQYGFTEQQTVAIGSAMIAAGAKADVAATSFRNVGKALVRGENATKAQRDAFAKLGLSAKDVASRMQKDAVGTLGDVIARIRKLPKEVQAANISALFGDEARAIAPLIANSKLLASSLDAVSDKTKYLGSAQAEFEVRSKTTENALQLFKNQMEGLAIAIGSALLPALNRILDAVGPIIGAMADWAAAHPNVTAALVTLASSLVAVNVAATAMRFAFLFGKGGMLSLAAGATSLASGLLTVLNPLKLVRGAFVALRFAIASTGIGAIVIGLAMAGTWIYNNWSNLSAMFSAFGAAFMRAVKPIMPALEPVMQAGQWLVDLWNNLTGTVSGGTGQWSLWGAQAGRAVGDVIVAMTELPGKIAEVAVQVAQSFWDGLKSYASGAVEFYSSILNHFVTLGTDLFNAGAAAAVKLWEGVKSANNVSEVVQAIVGAFKLLGEKLYQAGADAMQRLWDGLQAVANKIIAWASGMADKIAAPFRKVGNFVSGVASKLGLVGPDVAGARAAGGHIRAGETYLVGEGGQELVTPTRDAYVHNARDTNRMLGNQGGRGSMTITFGNLVLPNVTNAEEFVNEIESRLEERLAGLHSDLGYAGAQMLYMVGSVEIDTRPFPADKVSLSASSFWAEKAVIGAAPPSEFMGEGPETLSITGKLFPFKLGGLSELEVLKGYMRQGQVVPVMRGDGARLGSYAITSISDNHSLLQKGGVGFVVGYTLSLKKLPAAAGGQASTIEGLLSLFDEVWRQAMAEKIKVAGDNLTLDLLLVRRHGLKGQRLVAEALANNPGLADLGPILPVGLEITLPDLPVDVAEPVKVVTLFGTV